MRKIKDVCVFIGFALFVGVGILVIGYNWLKTLPKWNEGGRNE